MQIKMNIPYTSLNGFNDLFIDYLNKFDKAFIANKLPVLPNPVCISSNIRSVPVSVHLALSLLR